jgi:hypothetical protein
MRQFESGKDLSKMLSPFEIYPTIRGSRMEWIAFCAGFSTPVAKCPLSWNAFLLLGTLLQGQLQLYHPKPKITERDPARQVTDVDSISGRPPRNIGTLGIQRSGSLVSRREL